MILVLIVCLFTACGKGSTTITIDENGIASWNAVKGAVAYEYAYVDITNTDLGHMTTTETSVTVPEGFCVHMRVVYENGEKGGWNISDYFGEGVSLGYSGEDGAPEVVDDPFLYADPSFTVKIEDLLTYSLMENIDFDSVQPTADGGVSFVATAPKGGEMRFVGTPGVTVQPGAITFEPGSRIMALDAIGRICMYKPIVSDPGHSDNLLLFTGGYTFDGRTSVDSCEELFEWIGGVIPISDAYYLEDYTGVSTMHIQANMIIIGEDDINSKDSFTLSDLVVYYDETTYTTPIDEIVLAPDDYGVYLEGDIYNPGKEVFDIEKEIYDFRLLVMPALSDERNPKEHDFLTDFDYFYSRAVQCFSMDRVTIGELKDPDGNVVDKATYGLTYGTTLEVALDGGEFFDVPLPIINLYKGAQTLHQLTPYNNSFALGNVNALVIPIAWQDYPELADDALMDNVRTKFGRVIDTEGNVTDYSGDEAECYSLSGYFDAVSNGRYRIDSFVTDWCHVNYNLEDIITDDILGAIWRHDAYQWAKDTYPDMDWSRFDANADGIADAVIFIGANPQLDSFMMNTVGGATHNSPSYIPESITAADQVVLKNYIYIGSNFLETDNVLIHEYSHIFGLIDYYDVTYSGINAVGSFDMQSDNVGDWNAYSKYSVGWLDPHIVQNLAAGESVEYTIGAQSDGGNAIVIPAAGTEFDGPFGEYMMVDLFTDSGVNSCDAERYGLGNTTGVRIYHVNAAMECRVLTDDHGTEYSIGTVHYANAYSADGRYHIELLQKGGVNTFTVTNGPRLVLGPQDLFYTGDSFDAADYGEFLIDGKMDSGDEFGYIIEVTDITETNGKPVATIRVTRK